MRTSTAREAAVEQAKAQYFLEVPDELRKSLPARSKPPTPIKDALRAGKTIFVPFNGRTYRQTIFLVQTSPSAHHQGFRQRVRSMEKDGERGIVAWWVKL